ncbi:hypothetical protein [Paractinoplanes abujensis]|uniref:Uncharacterized protein n=1 Tax=Paractinoplanes abujensis TaxID=882441 RepID=A0A7W7D185_9ACTN|nr:hypothetical protein [Actinoplanes abujensis]MBB4696876.1 hypothetical protein [Actinoplanes abujensis]
MGSWGEQQCQIFEVEPEKMPRCTFAEGVLEGMGRGCPGLLSRPRSTMVAAE